MHEEVLGCVKKMYSKSMKVYFGLLICLVVLFAIMFGGDIEWVYITGLFALCIAIILMVVLIEAVRRKRGRENIIALFEKLNPLQQESLVEKIRQAPKGQWKTRFFATPEITFFTNSHGTHGVLTSDILWVYKKSDVFFPLYKHSTLVIHTKRQEKFLCEIGFCPIWSGRKQDDIIESAIGQLHKYFPGILSGYSREWYQLFLKDIMGMKKLYADREIRFNSH